MNEPLFRKLKSEGLIFDLDNTNDHTSMPDIPIEKTQSTSVSPNSTTSEVENYTPDDKK